ncbi:MAG TPA: triple tyrosine motif-containing protein [Clostridiaceae bacterium]
MNEIQLIFSLDSPQEKNAEVLISAFVQEEVELEYKFIIGFKGTWQTFKEFSLEKDFIWQPLEDGHYIIMVQVSEKNSLKPFDYVSKSDYIIGKIETKIISKVYIDKDKITVGDKITASVETFRVPVMYRYWIKENDNWQLVKDYSADNSLVWSIKKEGTEELLVECKDIQSKNSFDDFEKVQLNVLPFNKPQITEYNCLTKDLIVGEEFTFQVEAKHDDNRMILYKFVKIKPDGTVECIQDFSNKRIVSYVEEVIGSYKLLCLAKDLYSQNTFDDRAVMKFEVEAYNKVEIQSFTTDLSSPQVEETKVELKAIVSGGKNLLYRFIIDGNNGEDSGYIRDNFYIWNTKMPGDYKIDLWVKDLSFQGPFEVRKDLSFRVEEGNSSKIVINDVILDKNSPVLTNESINIKILAEGSLNLRYSFIVSREGLVVERVEYGSCNWVDFSPTKPGSYEIEILVKDKYSNREYDSHILTYVDALDYFPAVIDYILMPTSGKFMVGDKIFTEVVLRNTSSNLIKYILKIDGHKVEETGFDASSKYIFTPRYPGKYTIEIYAKNGNSMDEFDSRREVSFLIEDALPITDTKISSDKTTFKCNEGANFTVTNRGGKVVRYEFYLMEKDEWNLVQKYSRKNYYSFVAFSKGLSRLLVLCKSESKKCAYEDYDIMTFMVE